MVEFITALKQILHSYRLERSEQRPVNGPHPKCPFINRSICLDPCFIYKTIHPSCYVITSKAGTNECKSNSTVLYLETFLTIIMYTPERPEDEDLLVNRLIQVWLSHIANSDQPGSHNQFLSAAIANLECINVPGNTQII